MNEDMLLTGRSSDQRMVCGRQDRRHQAGRGLSPATWRRFHFADADQPLRPRRHTTIPNKPRAGGPDPPLSQRRRLAKAPSVSVWAPGGHGANSWRSMTSPCLRVCVEELFRRPFPQRRHRPRRDDRGFARLVADVVAYRGEIVFEQLPFPTARRSKLLMSAD